MTYWNDMLDKYGFGDGSREPAEARSARKLYIRAVNTLAKAFKSKHRAFAYNRGGMHNVCMICFTLAEQVEGKNPEIGIFEPTTFLSESDTDNAMGHAIEAAHDINLDGCIEVTVKVHTLDAMKNIAGAVREIMKTEK